MGPPELSCVTLSFPHWWLQQKEQAEIRWPQQKELSKWADWDNPIASSQGPQKGEEMSPAWLFYLWLIHSFIKTVLGLMCSETEKGDMVIKESWSLPSYCLQRIRGKGLSFHENFPNQNTSSRMPNKITIQTFTKLPRLTRPFYASL